MIFWLLPIFFFAVWSLVCLAMVAQVRAEETRRGVTADNRRNVSIFPVIPLYPLVFWALMSLINKISPPWGNISIGGFHIVLAIAAIYTSVRDIRFCRAHDNQQS